MSCAVSSVLPSTRGSFLTKKQDQAARKIMRFLRRCRHRCCPFPHWGGLGPNAASPSHRPDRPVSSDSFLVSPQDEGTEAESGAGRASPTRAGHLTSPLPFSSPWGPLLAVLTGRGLSGGGGAPCRQLSRHFCASPSWVSTPPPLRSAELPLPPLPPSLPSGSRPLLLVPGSRTPMPHIPASSAVTSGSCLPLLHSSLPACAHLGPFLTCLIYLFDASLNVSASVPPLPSLRARPSCFRADRAPTPTPHVCVCFLPFWPCLSPSTDRLRPPISGPKEGGVYIETRCGVLPRPRREGPCT